MDYKIEFLESFNDGNVFPAPVKAGETMIVDRITFDKIKQSAPTAVVIRGKMIPKPTRKCDECGVIYDIKKEHVCGETEN